MAPGIDNEHLYTGRRTDPETGLQLNRYRFYHSSLGRWVNRDPIGYGAGDANLYGYVMQSPTRYVDPSGREIWPDSMGSGLPWPMNDIGLFPDGTQKDTGKFDMTVRACSATELKANPGQCCTSVDVAYRPSPTEKGKCRRIKLVQHAKTKIEKDYYPDYNHDWHSDPPVEEQTDWASSPLPRGCSFECANFTDFPGGGPKSDKRYNPITFARFSRIYQEFEICAVCVDAAGNETNLGCRVYGHDCDLTVNVGIIESGGLPVMRNSCFTKRWGGGNGLDSQPPKHQPK